MNKTVHSEVNRLAAALFAGWILSSSVASATVDVLTDHNDGFNDGQNLNEPFLTTSNVSSTAFTKLFSVALDAGEAGQPLIKTGVNITTGTSQGVHDIVLVGTEKNSIYAFDAYSGTQLWKTSLLHSFHGFAVSTRGGVHTLTDAPAIDPATNVLYVESVEVENTNSIHVLSAINLADGSYYANPVNIAEGTNGSVYVSGPTTASGKKFDSYDLSSRCLTLDPVNHVVYMGFGDSGDVGPYNGWIIGYGETKDGSGNLDLAAVWCATPNGSEAGIWQAAGAICVDSSGNLFIETGNGTFDTTQVTPGYITDGRLTSLTDNANIAGGLQVPTSGDYGDSVVKLTPDSDTSQQSDNPNGFGLHVADFFSPDNEQALSNSDADLGSSSPVLLPNSVGSSAHQQLLVANDKNGVVFLIDRNNMGGYHGTAGGISGGTDNMVQELTGATHGAFSTAAFFAAGSSTAGTIYYATNRNETTGDVAKAFSITNAQINTTPTSTSASSYGTYTYSGSTPEISANGGSNGILWTIDRGPNRLVAYDAGNLGTVLFRSDSVAGNALTGSLVTFHTPTVANGHVYVGTSSALNVYGLPSSSYAPVFTSSAPTSPANAGVGYSFTCTASGAPSPTFSATPNSLPTGLSISSSGMISGTPTTPGTYTGVITATNGVSPAATQNFSITIYMTYASWAAAEGLTGNNAQQSAVLTADGLTNLFKYSLGLRPFTVYNPGNSSLPAVKLDITGKYLTLTFTGVATDVTYKVQASSNLSGPWTTLNTFSGPPAPGTVTVQDTQTTSAASQRYMRLVVSTSP